MAFHITLKHFPHMVLCSTISCDGCHLWFHVQFGSFKFQISVKNTPNDLPKGTTTTPIVLEGPIQLKPKIGHLGFLTGQKKNIHCVENNQRNIQAIFPFKCFNWFQRKLYLKYLSHWISDIHKKFFVKEHPIIMFVVLF